MSTPEAGRLWNGRFAPSPTGDLHVGNLRTALVAWLVARSHAGSFVVRMEDLDAAVARREHAQRQLRDLELLGLDWDGPVVFQSDRFELYENALQQLRAKDLVYECFCTRKEVLAAIQESSQAPNGPQLAGRYPGTCRNLTAAQRAKRSVEGRPPALRLRANADEGEVHDLLCGTHRFPIDDMVLRRNDGMWAYNFAVVVDDAEQQIGTVVRADDLLASTPRQQHLAHLLNYPTMQYVHVPLVVNAAGDRLAKRDGAVTLSDLLRLGLDSRWLLGRLAESLCLVDADARGSTDSPVALLDRFAVTALSRSPWRLEPDWNLR